MKQGAPDMPHKQTENPQHAQSSGTRRGRPRKTDLAAQPQAEPTLHVEVPQPPAMGIIGPCCGRGMTPLQKRKRKLENGNLVYSLICGACGTPLRRIITPSGGDTIQVTGGQA
jgi:hypothetical protein